MNMFGKIKFSSFFDYFSRFSVSGCLILLSVTLKTPLLYQHAGGAHRIRPARNYVPYLRHNVLEPQNPTRLLQIRILALDRQANVTGFGSKHFQKWSRTPRNILWYILLTSKKRLRRDKFTSYSCFTGVTGTSPKISC